MTGDVLEQYGLDPAAPSADEWRELIALAVASGASEEEIQRGIDERSLHAIPVQRGLVAGREQLTIESAGERAGLDPEFARRVWGALSLPDDEWTMCSERDVPLFEYFKVLGELIGREQALRSAYAMGAALSQLADSEVSQVRSAFEAPLRTSGGGNPDVARLLLGLLDAIPALNEAMLVVHRQHLHVAGRRYSLWGVRPSEASTTECVVGFADMVGSTSLGERLDAGQLDALLRNFEQRVARLATSRRTRLVKLIGDEALFVAGSPEEAMSIASSLLRDREIPELRVGLAAGEVVTRGGDVYGSVVNLASRLVAIAAPGQILVDARTVERFAPGGDARVEALGARALPGFAAPVDVFAVTPRRRAS